jgi:EAL domain-containing protein (putative c-di-GMP-specific phosphodiesterase class I)
MSTNKSDAQIVRSTVGLAHNLGLPVVAEGVETEETRDQLLALGCDYAQGYYVSRPLPPDRLISWIDRRGKDAEDIAALETLARS